MSNNNHCLHQELLQNHSLKIKELSTRNEFKEKDIMELKKDVKEIKDNVNKLITHSETQDLEIQKRLDTLETKVDLYDGFFEKIDKDKNQRLTHLIAIGGVLVAMSGIIVGIIL